MKEGQHLAAIMFTDIFGYTALMGKDVELGLELIRKNRQIHKPLIEKYGGMNDIYDRYLRHSFPAI